MKSKYGDGSNQTLGSTDLNDILKKYAFVSDPVVQTDTLIEHSKLMDFDYEGAYERIRSKYLP